MRIGLSLGSAVAASSGIDNATKQNEYRCRGNHRKQTNATNPYPSHHTPEQKGKKEIEKSAIKTPMSHMYM